MPNLPQQACKGITSVIIIGAGPVGLKISGLLLKNNPKVSIKLFGAEPYPPYDRVNLGTLLTDENAQADNLSIESPQVDHALQIHTNQQILTIDRKQKRVHSDSGTAHSYDTLILATGANALLPEFEGNNLAGVLTLRTIDDALQLRRLSKTAKNIIILGGGLLGLETAIALNRSDINIHILERSAALNHLKTGNEERDKKQKKIIDELNIHTGVNLVRAMGNTRVNAIELDNGKRLDCDILLLAVGIRPETSIATAAKLTVKQGIIVNDQLQTNDPNIYAIGDCAEHQDTTYGLITPGYEQADVLAQHLSGKDATYKGSTTKPRLKIESLTTKFNPDPLPNGEQLICDCNAVTYQQIITGIKQGNDNLEALCHATGAANNCGSCRPLLIDLLGKTAETKPPKSWLFLQIIALITIFTGLTYLLMPGLNYQSSMGSTLQWDEVWRNSLSRQISGFTLLTISLLVSLISLRKRIQVMRWGRFADWRNAHLILGLLITVALLIHTGARSGDNLDAILMWSFVVVLITGGMLTASIANEHKFSTKIARKIRISSLWLHLLTLWPLPALLGFHIMKSYYF